MGKSRQSADLVSDNNIFVDTTTDRVGIGTAIPQYDLDVAGDINFTGTFRQNGTHFVASRWTAGTGNDIYRLNGNVGIGTTNPVAVLDVRGNPWFRPNETGVKATALRLGRFSDSANAAFDIVTDDAVGDTIEIQSNRYAGALQFSRSSPSGIQTTFVLLSNYISGTSISIADTTGASTKIQLNEAGNTYFNNSGAILVGTSSSTGTASQKLQVTGGAYVSGNLGIGSVNPSARLNLYDTAGSASWRFRIGTNVSDGAGFYQRANGDFELVLRDSSNTNNYIVGRDGNLAMRPTSNVLINTETPSGTASQNLQVSGGAYVSGNLGVGVTNPASVLHTSGTITVGSPTQNQQVEYAIQSRVQSDPADVSRAAVILGTLSGSTSSDSYISFITNKYGVSRAERVRIDPNGNVGVGTTNPQERLVVYGPIAIGATNAIDLVGGARVPIRMVNDNGSLWTGGGMINEAYGSSVTAGYVARYARGTAAVPSQVLAEDRIGFLVGSGFGTSVFRNPGGINIHAEENFTDSSTGTYINFQTCNIGSSSRTEKVRITANGNVGVGTTNPQYKLHVVGSFGATTKSFIIDHPTKEGKKLQYGSLEGPELGVYVRGRTQSSVIELPEYWTELVDEDSITVNLTPIGKNPGVHSVIDISNNKIVIESTSDTINCFFTVFAERKDVDKLIVEY